ncbi:MAG TPA: DNA oxidative demethylase AlkB [Pseudolabrys sp.]|jgi:alkylated DNA repair protein (DNA oxidative demethylase)|nr:DNA oxidative demethylase AlkB [Pseudolabrys sp.]
MMTDLFSPPEAPPASRERIADGAVLLRARALDCESDILAELRRVTAQAPFRHMVTPGGFTMSAAMTNCGTAGWVTDRSGYRYDRCDPESRLPWPALPQTFRAIAATAAAEAGYADFVPDACLINRYEPGARMSLHQDKDERDFSNPIVSISLGLPATFQFGGRRRADPVRKHALHHGDIVVWGGPSRLCFHGVMSLKDGVHEKLGRTRINLTFRRAL